MSIVAYVGIDSHEASLSVCGFEEGAQFPAFAFKVANDTMEIKRAFAKLTSKYDLRCCYEASCGGYVLQRTLAEMSVSCEVIAPSLIPTRPGDKVKTDARDARNLALLYRVGQLTPIRIPTPEEESVRGLVRFRESLVCETTRTKNQVNRFLSLHGRRWPKKSRWTIKHWEWLRTQKFDETDRYVFDEMIALLEFKLARLKEIEKRIAQCAEAPTYKEAVGRLCCLRGMSLLSAMTLITEIIDFRRFGSASALMSFLGLTPREFSSGNSTRRSSITKTGNSRCRRILVEAAWKYAHKPALYEALKRRQAGQPADAVAHAWTAQVRLHKKFWSVASRKNKAKAVVATARELVGFVWALIVKPASSV